MMRKAYLHAQRCERDDTPKDVPLFSDRRLLNAALIDDDETN